MINNGHSPIEDISNEELSKSLQRTFIQLQIVKTIKV